MNLFSRHKNTVVLATVLLAQLLALAVQVKRQTAEGPVRLIRLVTVSTIAPFERMLIYTGGSVRGVWSNYIDLRSVRRENQQLKAESERMRLERAREQEDARQARRIQALLGFKEQWIDATVAAQVIGTSGSENSRLLYLDKGTKDGIKVDMPVITPDGVVGKILNVYGETAQVLMINDPTSGVGATLVNSRLQGIVKGTNTGEVQVITKQKARTPDTTGLGPIRASDILAQHLPGVPQTPPPGTPTAGTPQPSTVNGQAAPVGGVSAQAAPKAPAAPGAMQGAGQIAPKPQAVSPQAIKSPGTPVVKTGATPGTPAKVAASGAARAAAANANTAGGVAQRPAPATSKPATPKAVSSTGC